MTFKRQPIPLARLRLNNENDRHGPVPWIVSYDDQPEVAKLYAERRRIRYSLQYSAQDKRLGGELLIFCDDLRLPKTKNPGKFRVN